MTRPKAERDAVVRLKGALLDLTRAQRFTEANLVLEIIERIEPPLAGEAVPVTAAGARTRRSESTSLPPVTPAPATYNVRQLDGFGGPYPCRSCGEVLAAHCTVHLLPCCPGSLMHGQDEGTWTP